MYHFIIIVNIIYYICIYIYMYPVYIYPWLVVLDTTN